MSKRARMSSTPHRLSRSSNVLPSPGVHYPIDAEKTPLDETLLPSIVEFNDSLVDLDSNLQSLQKIHESLISFNESFGSFLYGLQMNAYTVEFNEIPTTNDLNSLKTEEIKDKISRLEEYFDEKKVQGYSHTTNRAVSQDPDDTYLTNDEDGSFLAQPETSKRRTTLSKSKIPVGRRVTTTGNSGGVTKPTLASERKQRAPVKNNSRPPFR